MIVLDASVLLELVLGTSTGHTVAARIANPSVSLHAPDLVDLEIAQVLRRFVAKGLVTSVRAQLALDDFLDLELRRYDHESLLARIWELKDNATAYDAAYLALAEVLDAPLLTHDPKLAGVAGSRAKVVVI